MRALSTVTVGIVTALPEEYAAVQLMLRDVEDKASSGTGAGQRYATGFIPAAGGDDHSVALCLTHPGNNSAAARATQLLTHCPNITTIVMVGIAGAIPNPTNAADHVRLGDIVISDLGGVFQYDYVKEHDTWTESRAVLKPPDARLVEAARLLSADLLIGKKPWLNHLALGAEVFRRPLDSEDKLHDAEGNVVPHPSDSDRVEGEPRVFSGRIASGNVLLKNRAHRDRLRDDFKVKAVEMEGSGIADAAWSAARGYFVIRGTCDYCDKWKNDDWHKYAALVAAAYCRALLENTFTQDGTVAPSRSPTSHELSPVIERLDRLVAMFDQANSSAQRLAISGIRIPDTFYAGGHAADGLKMRLAETGDEWVHFRDVAIVSLSAFPDLLKRIFPISLDGEQHSITTLPNMTTDQTQQQLHSLGRSIKAARSALDSLRES
jgi:nucleoside phosphorylase